jgi:hypothetical protein
MSLTVASGPSRYILFALTERQKALLRDLQSIENPNANIQPLIANIEGTRVAATRCLDDLAIRTQQPAPPTPLSIRDQANLLMEYQNICYNAVLYRTGQAPHSQLAAISGNRDKSSCQRCGAVFMPRRMAIPGADRSSCVLINLSGLFRAHCNAGNGLTCIWELRVPSCYGVFPDEKALLQHMLEVHVRDDGSGVNLGVDWPADVRSGNLEKCGYSVRINGSHMRVDQGGRLVVPIQRAATTVTGVGSSMSSIVSPMASTISLGYSESTISGGSALPEMDPTEARERVEIPSTEVFEMPGPPPYYQA